jgi:hypothetical protein
VLHIGGGRAGNEFGQEAAVEMQPLAADVGAGLFPGVDRDFIAEVDADLFEDGHRGLVQGFQALRRQQLVDGDFAADELFLDQGRAGAGRSPRFRPTPSTMLNRRCHACLAASSGLFARP